MNDEVDNHIGGHSPSGEEILHAVGLFLPFSHEKRAHKRDFSLMSFLCTSYESTMLSFHSGKTPILPRWEVLYPVFCHGERF
jgi:hypothetical protein